jgi:hypothetical protein
LLECLFPVGGDASFDESPVGLAFGCGEASFFGSIAGSFVFDVAADVVLSDGGGNPPRGWGNPSQPGRLVRTTPTSALFTPVASDGVNLESVSFHYTDATDCPFICS